MRLDVHSGLEGVAKLETHRGLEGVVCVPSEVIELFTCKLEPLNTGRLRKGSWYRGSPEKEINDNGVPFLKKKIQILGKEVGKWVDFSGLSLLFLFLGSGNWHRGCTEKEINDNPEKGGGENWGNWC